MYMNFWYAAEWGSALTAAPLKVRMLGQDFVLFRDSSGQAHCLANVCVHRGGSLAGGRVQGDCIECPYHGWQYGGDGRCRKIPSLGPEGQARLPGRARVDSYPVVERYGLVHVFLGDLPEAERPGIMEIPEYGRDGWYASCEDYLGTGDFRRSVENGLDPAHNEYVHPTHGFSGTRDDYRVPELKVEERPWGSGFITTYFAPPLTDEKMKQASGRSGNAVINAGTFHHGPSCMTTYIHPTADHSIHQNVYMTPVDELHKRVFLVQTRNFLHGEEHDTRFRERNAVVRNQDLAVLSDLEPKFNPETNAHELLMPSDQGVARYREKLKEWQQFGWRIDSARVNAERMSKTYAIPCPARRAGSGGWVLDPVPTMAPAKEERGAAVAGIAQRG